MTGARTIRGAGWARWSICAALAGLLAAPASAFKVPIHRQITVDALRTYFNEFALAEIQDANQCVDEGPVIDGPDDKDDQPCVPLGLGRGLDSAGSDLYGEQLLQPDFHFDDESFADSIRRIRSLMQRTVTAIKQHKYTQARKLLGAALHTLQDFYAHSNWVELERPAGELYLLITDLNMPVGAPFRGVMLAGKNDEVCWAAWPGKLTGLAEAGGSLLTSGYYLPGSKTTVLPPSKCRHGDLPDKAVPGINKDSPDAAHAEFHDRARELAREHTLELMVAVLNLALKQVDKTEIKPFFTATPPDISAVVTMDATKITRIGPVRAGDIVEFRAAGTIVWGREGDLGNALNVLRNPVGAVFDAMMAKPISCGPDGTPGVNFVNHPSLVAPPMPQVNVGALIGRLYPVDCLPTDSACTNLGNFYIGQAVKAHIKVDAVLYLQVNDGVLSNNQGAFKVLLKKVEKAAGTP